MSMDAMDELLALYRCAARERSPVQADARILRAAEQRATWQRVGRQARWLAALAASVLLWSAWHALAPHRTPSHATLLGYDAGRVRADLLRMGATPPSTDITRYLREADVATPHQSKENAP